MQAQLEAEKEALKKLEAEYKAALAAINEKVKLFDYDIGQLDAALQTPGLDEKAVARLESMKRSKVYQKQYQEALKGQIGGIVDKLHGDTYSTISEYLNGCYTDGFLGTMYSLHRQGIPLIMPIDQAAVIKAVQLDSKISNGLYTRLGVDSARLKKVITSEITRGVASSMSYADIARNIRNASSAPLSNCCRIARTEGHRIQQASAADARNAAKKKGADVLKQWDATLDGRTRDTHRLLDGQIRETDEPFEANGKKAMEPGGFGDPAEDCNCRCVALTRARWALDEDELKTLKERAEYFGLDKTKDFEEYKEKYLNLYRSSGKAGDTDGYSVIDSVSPFNFSDKAAVQKEVDTFLKEFADAPEEHAIVISPTGQLFRLTGTVADVETGLVGEDALAGSIGMHNHPVWEGFESGDSFSLQDVIFSVQFKTGTEYLTTGGKRYSFEYKGTLTVDQIAEEYQKAQNHVRSIAFDTGQAIEYEQEAIMRYLAKTVEGFIFNENL